MLTLHVLSQCEYRVRGIALTSSVWWVLSDGDGVKPIIDNGKRASPGICVDKLRYNYIWFDIPYRPKTCQSLRTQESCWLA